MPETKGPSYISSHSADVILSDIRPTKLKPDALRTINILLDEFLYKLLSISSSLATDKLKASLNSLLPTNLGKEALLEAEVEIRAYWERTTSRASVDDDSRTFQLQWAFELLRLKCEGYSTLNEEDEDPNLEGRVGEKLGKTHPHLPKAGLVDPAALYLTAILESICEHILSNVARVVARDSSRTNATVNDLFVALCEDDSIYGLFKTMKVYEQIELMSKGPQARRSKSITRHDPVPPPRTSSPKSSRSRSQQSIDRQSANTNPASGSGSGTSFEKSRAMRMYVNSNNKVSSEQDDSQAGHQKSESWRSETSRQMFVDEDIPNIAEDATMLREFDDLMRSTSTMKVSLTPDRLRTMEVYKQEKDQNRRPPPPFSLSKPDIPPASQLHNQKHSLQPDDSIIEDEEENNSLQTSHRARKGSKASQSTSSFVSGRIRAVSTSSSGIRSANKNPIRSPSVQVPPSALPRNIPGTDMVQSREVRKATENGLPARIRTRQHRSDSLELDDVMNGSDDHGDQRSIPTNQKLSPARQHTGRVKVSSQTRDLMAFLDEGPPDTMVGNELLNFIAQGPPEYGGSSMTLDSPKPKGAGRLQRMISKLSIGGEKGKGVSDALKSPSLKQPPTPVRPTISTPSVTSQPTTPISTLSSLANRPIPPRPRPLSPPPSPEKFSYDEDKPVRNPLPNSHQDTPFRETLLVAKPLPVPTTTTPSIKDTQENCLTTHVNGNARNRHSSNEVTSEPQQSLLPARSMSRKVVPPIDLASTAPFFTQADAKDMQRLITNAATVDECRLIFDMFMARKGISKGPAPETDAVPYPSPSPSVIRQPLVDIGEALIESTLLEIFLGGTSMPDVISRALSEQSQPDVPIEAAGVLIEAQVEPATDSQPPSSKLSVLPSSIHP